MEQGPADAADRDLARAPAAVDATGAPESPISDAGLEQAAARVAEALRRVRKRAPKEVTRAVREALEAVFAVVEGGQRAPAPRVALLRRLEALDGELHARDIFVPQFYEGARLAVVRRYDPIRIRFVVDEGAARAHIDRYVGRIARQERRLRYFYERAGLQVDPVPELRPWEQPYAAMEVDREFLWRKPRTFSG